MPLSLSDQERARVAGIEAIARLGAGGVAPLIAQLTEVSWAVRRAVVAALAELGDLAVEPLCAVLREQRDDEARLAAAVDALAQSRGAADASLLRLTDTPIPATVCDALQVLGRRRSAAAVPRLAALIHHEDDNVALAAIEALGRIGGDDAVDPLIAAVESRNFFRSFPAIDVLGRTGDARAIAPLASLLAEPHYAVEAARALGRAGDHAAVRPLARLLAKGNDAQLRAAAVALAEIDAHQTARFGASGIGEEMAKVEGGPAASRRILQSLTRADASEKASLCRVLGWLGGEAAVVGLIDILDAEPATAQAAVEALAMLGPTAGPELSRALREPGERASERRAAILPLLGGRQAARDDIILCLTDESAEVRVLACEALGHTGDPAAVAALFPLLADVDMRVQQAAVAAIQSLGSAETERLALEAARSSEPQVRRAALRIISYFGYRSGLEILIEAMEDPDERIRDAATFGLPFVDDPRAQGALFAASAHASARTRAAAARALGQTSREPAVTERLRALLRDPDAWVRYYACQALSRLKDLESAEAISPLIDDPAGQVRVAVIEALASLKGESALDALREAARSVEPDVRRAALIGLGMVKRPESIELLQEAARAADSATRLVALSALAEHDAPEAIAALGAAASDPHEAVRHAAIALLAARPGALPTQALVAHLLNASIQERVVGALSQHVSGRIEAIMDALRAASGEVAPLLVSALARMRRADASAAITEAFAFDNAHARRAIAAALIATRTKAARAMLERAAATDPDAEVRRISGVAAEL